MPVGTAVTQLFREYIARVAGLDQEDAERFSQEFDAQLKSSDWLELLDGTPFHKKSSKDISPCPNCGSENVDRHRPIDIDGLEEVGAVYLCSDCEVEHMLVLLPIRVERW